MLPETLPGLNLAQALERQDGDVAFVKSLLLVFASKHGEVDREIRQALSCGDREQAIRCVHTMKSVSSYIGATQLQTLATKLESVLKEEDEVQLKPLLADFSTEVGQVMASIDKLELEPA
ncbi:MAG: Hpt domain-containing protein [Desulfuromonadales bacterium]|nr:Hpt domain-containing protein [Desulfuromonadales bacterium]